MLHFFGLSYLHCLFCAVSSCLSERTLHLHSLLGDGGKELFTALCLRVILSKLRQQEGGKKHLGTCTHTLVHSSPSSRYTDQAGKSCEGFFLVGHSTSVVTSDAHPLGQQVLAAQDAKVEKHDFREGGTQENDHLTGCLLESSMHVHRAKKGSMQLEGVSQVLPCVIFCQH